MIKDSLKNDVLKRNPLNKNIKDSLPEPRFILGSGLKNRRSRIFQWILNPFAEDQCRTEFCAGDGGGCKTYPRKIF